jgi:peptide/nickel transport system ATP-binding protein
MKPVLSIKNYSLEYETGSTRHRVLDQVTLEIKKGEVLGLVGESGSGKSTLAWALMRYLPPNARESDAGVLSLGDLDLRTAKPKVLEDIRGSRMSMVFQDPATALNPTMTIGRQVCEVLSRHQNLNKAQAYQAALEALRHVELRNPEALMQRYPHQASGGEKQRVIIATAFACRPELIIFDEPTTALDVINGARILELFARLREETGVSALYISHDLALVSRVADSVAVLERGKIVEQAPGRTIFQAPAHPYTQKLVSAVPRPDRRLVEDEPSEGLLLQAKDIAVRYERKKMFRPAPKPATAKISLDIRPGEILGVVGESGSGKSSMAKALTGLADYDGDITLAGRRISGEKDMDNDYRRDVQIIFQHPDTSLNPRQTIRQILSRPLKLYGGNLDRISGLLEEVRLPAEFADRYPHQLSGGQKQRVAIARAFAAQPKLIICDEITAPLDVSVQASVIELLLNLRKRSGTAYMFITHDINLVCQIAHRIAVMRNGELVDLLTIDELRAGQVHPYTRELIETSPTPVG